MPENADQNNSEYGHFLRSGLLHLLLIILSEKAHFSYVRSSNPEVFCSKKNRKF